MNTRHPSTNPSRAVPDKPTSSVADIESDFCERVSVLAKQLLSAALLRQTNRERKEAAKLGRLMVDPVGKAFTFAMVDEVFRSRNPSVAAGRWRGLLRVFGVPRFLPWMDRALMHIGNVASRVIPKVVMAGVAARMRAESSNVILAGEKEPLHRYLAERKAEGFHINLNHLGEAVLGEQEASHRLSAVLEHLEDPAVAYISVKISSIFSQISLIAWNETLTEIKSRLRVLYRAAAKREKFVNLDMEEYRDLSLTITAFRELLEEPEFFRLSAGIVLQAYLPDSFAAQQELTAWGRKRVAAGGAPIKIRLVKGANLAMESVDAELHGWRTAPYSTKADTDANFRRMLDYGCLPENANAVRLGVASHNLFDVALAIALRELNIVESQIEIEMLEGMANHQARAVRDVAGGLLLYAPAVRQDNFLSAMAYLVRRLDENTAPENFLREMFAMRPGSPEWERQKERFVQGWHARRSVSSVSRRSTTPPPTPLLPPRPVFGEREPGGEGKSRSETLPPHRQPLSSEINCEVSEDFRSELSTDFQNTPDSDWTQQSIRAEMEVAIERWQPETLPEVPELDCMLSRAVSSHLDWEAKGNCHRARILERVAEIMSVERYRTIACLRSDGKKSIADADGEVSEAIDFARYYARAAQSPPSVIAKPLGVVAVVSPWNFPYAIPAGGILAALMAGNSVILKPARATLQTAWILVQQLWAAGVPREVLHFFPCDNDVGKAFLCDHRVACVVLTGSYETARKFQSWRPSLPLLAETSGKNALIVTAQADRELAIKDLVRSAFGHSGQKCSAASLAILEAEVYDDPVFRRQLLDATQSLHAGLATDRRSIVTPLVIAPSSNLIRALTTLDEGEEWLLKPQQIGSDPCVWTPGIKLGVRPNSWFHRTECFGPVLGLMRAVSLQQATEWQNATDYGLTAGLHTLDPDEIAWWRNQAQAGNLYINRPITGAIVQRQPFGGWKRSCIGPGAKAGGPNYVRSFYHWEDCGSNPVDYETAWAKHFAIEHDPSALKCESNVFRYRPCRGVILRLDASDKQTILRAEMAARITNVPLAISIREIESDEQFIERLPELAAKGEFLRTINTPSDQVLRTANEFGLNWINAPLLACGRIELTRWLREQSISETLHRYGQLSDPATSRRPPFPITIH